MTPVRSPAVVALAGLFVLACGHAGPVPVGQSAPVTEAASREAAIARARADSMRLPYTAADIHFMTAMIHHHAQAIEMARLAPTRGASGPVRLLASRIINAQEDEIGTMVRWLEDRRQPVPPITGGPMKMVMDGVEHEMLMPGMLSAAQMAELERARGTRFDELFLRFMLQHHRGAVTMVKELFATDGAGQDETVFRFATDVNVDQATEINRMERMLVEVLVGAQSP